MSAIMCLDATPDKLELFEDRVVLTGVAHRSILGKGGSKTLYIRQITGVQFKSASTFGPGWIHFVVPGDHELRPGVQGAAANPNTVLFQKKDLALAEQIKAKVEELIAIA